MIPRLPTARLLLRAPHLDDFETYAADAADEEARRLSTGVIDRRDAWRRFHSMAGSWLIQGLGWWTVEAVGEGPVGWVGVSRRETNPDWEIGWGIVRARWGRGYATEAARAALDHAMTTFGAPRVIANIAKANTASIAVAEKIGMRCVGEVDFYGDLDLRYVAEG